MKASHLKASTHVRQPWKNGGGVTTEIARHGTGDLFTWRVSIADVERSGPFSDFAGYDRTIVLLRGDGMELDVDGRPVRLQPRAPFVFDGGARTEGRLVGGPVRDLNLMARRGHASGCIDVIAQPTTFTISSTWSLLLALDGDASIACADGEWRLESGDALLLDHADSEIRVDALTNGAALLHIRIQHKA